MGPERAEILSKVAGFLGKNQASKERKERV